MYYEIEITLTASRTPKERKETFETVVHKCKDIKEVKKFLVNEYGKEVWKKSKQKIYMDKDDDTEEVGFIWTYWDLDYSSQKRIHCQDWIRIYKVERKLVLLK